MITVYEAKNELKRYRTEVWNERPVLEQIKLYREPRRSQSKLSKLHDDRITIDFRGLEEIFPTLENSIFLC